MSTRFCAPADPFVRSPAKGKREILKKLLRNRGIAAVVGSFMLVLGTGNAAAQTTAQVNTNYSLNAGAVNTAAKPLGAQGSVPIVSAVQRTITSTTNVFSNALGTMFGTPGLSPHQAEEAKIAREGRWLYSAGWPLYALVDRYSAGVPLDQESNCLATAVYFEARGETLEGQLAVARVVMNRAASGKYPPSICDTVKQPWQFSFVRHGQFPAVRDMDAWNKAQGIARIALANAVPSLPSDVLWYHADYCNPAWGARLTQFEKIGTHIFYRA
jgi:N-acetylmuramoyl-L-alanine amidase